MPALVSDGNPFPILSSPLARWGWSPEFRDPVDSKKRYGAHPAAAVERKFLFPLSGCAPVPLAATAGVEA